MLGLGLPRARSNEFQLLHILDGEKFLVFHIRSDRPANSNRDQQEIRCSLYVGLHAEIEIGCTIRLLSIAEPETKKVRSKSKLFLVNFRSEFTDFVL